MENCTRRSNTPWQKYENILSVQILKTPPLECAAAQTPKAPKKLVVSHKIRKEGLKPRKLSYESENMEIKDGNTVNKAAQSSAAAFWLTNSSVINAQDIDKENRPIVGKRHKYRDSKACIKSSDRVHDRGRKDAGFKSDFRPIRI